MNKRIRRIIGVVVSVLLPTLIGLWTNIATGLSDNPLAHLPSWLVWTITSLLVLVALIWAFYGQQSPSGSLSRPAFTESQAFTNRQRMINRVRSTWIKGVLEQSLYKHVQLVLGLKDRADALTDPWHLSLLRQGQKPTLLPEGIDILKVYDAAAGELLILGKPGAGKTTLLLELTRGLLSRAQRDKQHPLPVVFNLSSWVSKRQSFGQWMVEQLRVHYGVPLLVAQTWVAQGQLLLLLDGLDEVASKHRRACLEAIERHRQGVSAAPIVISCRTQDYFDQEHRLALSTAIEVQPLTVAQIRKTLTQLKFSSASLQQELREDVTLSELVTTPLMLHILLLAFHDHPLSAALLSGTLQERRKHLFSVYIEQMLYRRKPLRDFRAEQMLSWLSELARQMQRTHQTIFTVESLQPDWLSGVQRMLYHVSVGLVGGLLIGLLIGLPIGLSFGLPSGWVSALIGWGIGWLVFALKEKIKPAEELTWSGQLPDIIGAQLVGLIIGSFLGLMLSQFSGLFFGLGVGLLIGLVPCLLVGLSGKQLSERLSLSPNEGIWRSGENGLLVGMYGALVGVLLGGLLSGSGVLFGGLLGELVIGLAFGLLAFIQHFTLRIVLWRSGRLPWHLVPFLDEGVERLLLRRVGGGYMFVHLQLRDFFACQ